MLSSQISDLELLLIHLQAFCMPSLKVFVCSIFSKNPLNHVLSATKSLSWTCVRTREPFQMCGGHLPSPILSAILLKRGRCFFQFNVISFVQFALVFIGQSARFSPNSFGVTALMFKSLVQLQLIFGKAEMGSRFILLFLNMEFAQQYVWEKLPILQCCVVFAPLLKISCQQVVFQALFSVLLICVTITMTQNMLF